MLYCDTHTDISFFSYIPCCDCYKFATKLRSSTVDYVKYTRNQLFLVVNLKSYVDSWCYREKNVLYSNFSDKDVENRKNLCILQEDHPRLQSLTISKWHVEHQSAGKYVRCDTSGHCIAKFHHERLFHKTFRLLSEKRIIKKSALLFVDLSKFFHF